MSTPSTVTPTELAEITLTVTRNGSGPAVVLLHGFPGIAYSWRHQIPALADAGYAVIAPDMRGYGWSDQPAGVEQYAMTELVGDVIGLLDHDGVDDAVIVGHDWGAVVASWVALFRPDRVRGVALLSVPYSPRSDTPDVDEAMQQDGIAEALEADPIATLRRMYWSLSASAPPPGEPLPAGLPPHLTQGEFENYYRAFVRSGFANPINHLRNMYPNWVGGRPWHKAKLAMPVTFIAGASTGVSVEAMNNTCADLRGIHLIDGAGHWVQEEAPEKVTALLLDFLESLDA